MIRVWTQTEIYNYLLSNPLNAKVHTGSLEDMNNEDYIFFDMLSEQVLASDNNGLYKSTVQFTVATKDFDRRKTLVKYIKEMFVCSIEYLRSDEAEYYIAYCSTALFMREEEDNG